MGIIHGKGTYEYYEDGRKEAGQWVKNKRQGEFECYDKNGTLTHKMTYKDDEVIKYEEVQQKI